MKKHVTLLSILVLTGGIAFGQSAISQSIPTMRKAPSKISIDHSKTTSNHSAEKAGGDLVWSDDFSGATTWALGGDGAQGDWVLATGPADAGVADATDYMGAMASTTAANGFAGFDGTQYLLAANVLVQNAWVASEIINFTGIQTIDVTFEERYRAFNTDQTFVELSTDGGLTWSDTVEVNTDAATNGPAYQGPLTVTLYVGGTTQGMIRFRWSSPVADNNFGSGYGWFVDDVSITEGYLNNLTLTNPYNVTGVQNLQYSKFPKSQVAAAAVTSFGTIIKNIGTNSQDAVLNIVEPTTSYAGVTAPPVTIASFMEDTVDVAMASGFTIPATVGMYNFGYEVTASVTLDATTDDVAAMSMEVTDNIMAVDAYDGTAASITGGFTGWQSGTGDAGIGTYFEIFQTTGFQSVQVGVQDIAAADQAQYLNMLNVSIYKYDGSAFQAYAISNDVQITNGDFGNLVDVPFSAPVNVIAGDVIMVVAGFYDQAPVPIAFAGFIPDGQTIGLNGGTITGLLSDNGLNVEAPVVRIDFSNVVVIAPDADQTIMQDVNGSPLTVITEGPGTATSREWKFSTTSGSGYASFATAQTGISYTPNFPNVGVYYVVCESTFPGPEVATSNEVKINVILNTGIEENTAPNFAVYSVENGLNVDLSSTELKGATIQVVSMDGKVVAKQALTTNQMNTIKVNVPTGIYFYAISNDSSSYQGKVFIK